MRKTSLLPFLPLALVLLGSALVGAVPLLYFHATTGMWLPHIMPQLSSDGLYYLKQVREVLDGHPSLGNPFIREYADAHFPGLLLPIWIGAIPGFFGLGMNGVFIWNGIFYSALTGIFLYLLLLRLTQGQKFLSAGTALLGVISLHIFLIRPILQVVYPAFALYFLCLFLVLEKPHEAVRYLWLGIAAAFAFYVYPHLWMPEFAGIGLLFLRSLWKHDFRSVRLFCFLGMGVVLVCIPEILTILSLFSDPMAKVINIRSGLVETHRILPLTVMNLKYVILLVVAMSYVGIRKTLSKTELLILIIGTAILAAAFSNTVTGKEMDLETHPEWMSLLLMIVAIGIFASELRRKENATRKFITATLLFVLLGTTGVRILRNSFAYTAELDTKASRTSQDYARVFSFLEKSSIHQSVLLTPNQLGNYVTIYTDDYLVYSPLAEFHVIPSDELMERFLTQNVNSVTPDLLKNNVRTLAGWGPFHTSIYLNAYGGNVQPLDLVGGQAFIDSAMAKERDVNTHYEAYLKKFHAEYAITDVSAPDNPRIPKTAKKIYSDARFTVYALSQK